MTTRLNGGLSSFHSSFVTFFASDSPYCLVAASTELLYLSLSLTTLLTMGFMTPLLCCGFREDGSEGRGEGSIPVLGRFRFARSPRWLVSPARAGAMRTRA